VSRARKAPSPSPSGEAETDDADAVRSCRPGLSGPHASPPPASTGSEGTAFPHESLCARVSGSSARERVFLSGWGVAQPVGSSFSDPPPKNRRRGLIRGNNTAREAPMAEPPLPSLRTEAAGTKIGTKDDPNPVRGARSSPTRRRASASGGHPDTLLARGFSRDGKRNARKFPSRPASGL